MCHHPPNHHKKRSGACMATPNCLCGWEIRNGIWYEIKGWIRHGRKKKSAKGKSRHFRNILQGPCYFCGKPAKTVDHMLARRFGGRNSPENTVGACKRCNNLKGSMVYEEFIEITERLMWWEFEEDKKKRKEGSHYVGPRSDEVVFVSASGDYTPQRIRRVLHPGVHVRMGSPRRRQVYGTPEIRWACLPRSIRGQGTGTRRPGTGFPDSDEEFGESPDTPFAEGA